MSSLRPILLVDDDPRDVELTRLALSENHLANPVEVARDGQEALDYLYRRGRFAPRAEENPIFVLLDLKMPKVDGMEVIRAVKADERLRTIPIVVLTSSRVARELDECYRLGVNAFVVKPVAFPEFIAAVKQIGAFWAVVNHPPAELLDAP